MYRPTLPRRRTGFLGARSVLLLSIGWYLLFAAPALAQTGANDPGVLTTRDKALINTAAERLIGSYTDILNMFSRYDASSSSDVEDVKLLVAAITQGEDRIFTDTTAIIESDLDPSIQPGKAVPNLTAPVYLLDFFTVFHGDVQNPITMRLADYGEPHTTPDGLVVTSLLYNVSWQGSNKNTGTSYTPHQRVILFTAARQGPKDWVVHIATDSWYDPANPFKSYRKELEAERARSKDRIEAVLKEYEDEARQAASEAARSLEERTASYDAAIAKGDVLLNDDPEGAMILYDKARDLAPVGRLDHLLQSRKAQRALDAKNTSERERALDTLSARLVRLVVHGGFRSVTILDMTETNGVKSALGSHLSNELAGRMARMASHFTVSRGLAAGRGGAAIGGNLMRVGGNRIGLTATLQDKRGNVRGQEKEDLPMPEGFDQGGAEPNNDDLTSRNKAPGLWSVGVSVGLNLTRISGRNVLSDRFTENGIGPRAGIDVERMGATGIHRFATGVRWASFNVSTTGDDVSKQLKVDYVQVPLLYRIFTGRTAIGRFGLQAGVLADFTVGALSESYTSKEYIDVSFLNAHASGGLCYETNGPGRTRITANVSYDPMILAGIGRYLNASDLNLNGTPKEDPLLPSGGPKLSAISFAVGVMFRPDPVARKRF